MNSTPAHSNARQVTPNDSAANRCTMVRNGDTSAHDLAVQFDNGRTHIYENVPGNFVMVWSVPIQKILSSGTEGTNWEILE